MSDAGGGGDVAVWSVSPGDVISASAESFTAQVSRLDCNDGVTGEVLAPSIEIGETAIVVTFEVVSLPPGMHTCPSNNEVAYLVTLGQPIGDRELVDGACRTDHARATSFCWDGSTRWQP